VKRSVVVTDQTQELRDFEGQVAVAAVPPPERYEVGQWIEVLISESDPRIVWRLRCADVER
jgi:hypothetical protein